MKYFKKFVCILFFFHGLFSSKNPDSWHCIHVYTPIIKVLCHYLDNKCLEWKENRRMGKIKVLCSYMLQESVCHIKGFETSKKGLLVPGESLCSPRHSKTVWSKGWRTVITDQRKENAWSREHDVSQEFWNHKDKEEDLLVAQMVKNLPAV